MWLDFLIKATSGVPQGSHLGPLLFILFMNDVPEILNYSNCLMFADDLKIFCSFKSILDALNLQRDLDMLSSWCQSNRLSLNINICKIMSFYRCHYPVISWNSWQFVRKNTWNKRPWCCLWQNSIFCVPRWLYCCKSVFDAWFHDENMRWF